MAALPNVSELMEALETSHLADIETHEIIRDENDTNSASDDASDSGSNSTYEFGECGHEAFETFQKKVLALASNKIWPDSNPENISVERLVGGSYNRIIGIAKKPENPAEDSTELILRVPRYEDTDILDDIAALHFVRRKLTVPIPNVICFDTDTDNEIERAFMVQERLEGTRLAKTYGDMTHKQKCHVATELGGIVSQLHAVDSPGAGRLTFPADNKTPNAPMSVKLLQMQHGFFEYAMEEGATTPRSTPVAPYETAPRESVLETLSRMFQELISLLGIIRADEPLICERYVHFIEMAKQLDEDGWFKDVHNSLVHLDLEPRNMMARTTDSFEGPLITGVLDWDSAILGPTFLACKPPAWLWADFDNEDDSVDMEDERAADNAPQTEERQQIKRLFEDAAGPDYARFAYQPAYRLARRLFLFALEGVSTNEHHEELREILDEWKKIRSCAV